MLPGWSSSDNGFINVSNDALEDRLNSEIDYELELTIGYRGDEIDSRFSVRVVTPEALSVCQRGSAWVLADRAVLTISRLDMTNLEDYLECIVSSCTLGSLHASVAALQQYFRWEYDDYDQMGHGNVDDGHIGLEVADIRTSSGQVFRSLCPWDNVEVDYSIEMTIRDRSRSQEAVLGVRIVSPEALLQKSTAGVFVMAHSATLIVAQFDWRDVLEWIEKIVHNCHAARFHESIWLLRRYFRLHDDVSSNKQSVTP